MQESLSSFRRSLLRWYRQTARPFPWRSASPDPYVVLVSETMLQQTQAARVAELLPPFLAAFPTVRHLADATSAEVIRAWKGLGYNSRAIRLRDAARMIAERHQGNVPTTVEELRALPGFGPYASASVACFAFNRRVVVIDVNVRRVYSRWMECQPTTIDMATPADLLAFAENAMPRTNAAEWYHAVMDLGATICTARRPACSICPVRHICPSSGNMAEAVRPATVERQFRGKPYRIWRGRMVELLRHQPDGLAVGELYEQVFQEPPAEADMEWMWSIIKALVRDRIVTSTDGTVRLAH